MNSRYSGRRYLAWELRHVGRGHFTGGLTMHEAWGTLAMTSLRVQKCTKKPAAKLESIGAIKQKSLHWLDIYGPSSVYAIYSEII